MIVNNIKMTVHEGVYELNLYKKRKRQTREVKVNLTSYSNACQWVSDIYQWGVRMKKRNKMIKKRKITILEFHNAHCNFKMLLNMKLHFISF